jgi:hypothetical protein
VLRRLKTINLTATDLDADGSEELIGSFFVDSSRSTRQSLFLLAEPQAQGFRVGLSQFSRIRAQEMMDPAVFEQVGEDGFLAEVLIDQLDLDGGGAAEVLTFSRSFEGSAFKIYRKQRGRWREAYTFYSYRCGY